MVSSSGVGPLSSTVARLGVAEGIVRSGPSDTPRIPTTNTDTDLYGDVGVRCSTAIG